MNKFSANAYEIELPIGIGISSIFNVADLYKYQEGETRYVMDSEEVAVQFLNQSPASNPF